MKTLLLAWPGPRARAYLQMMCLQGMKPSHVLLMGDASADITSTQWGCLQTELDLDEPLRETIRKHEIPCSEFAIMDIHCPELVEYVESIDCDQAIFSGGGIMKKPLLQAAPEWIHVHPGRLPDMRGSTCIYYALLLHGHSSATAFRMTAGLDEGAILAQADFPPPGALSAEDFDHGYDAWIRASVLLKALRNIHAGKATTLQNPVEGQMFYIIHPVLKHLAVLSAASTRLEPERDHVHTLEHS